jgi:fucose permease
MKFLNSYDLSYIVIGISAGIIGPSIPSLSRQTGTDLGGISFVFPVIALGNITGSFFGGRIYDKVKGHPIFGGALALLLVCLASIPFIPFIVILLVLFLFLGFATGSMDVGGNALLIWVHRDKVGPYMMGLHFFFGVGAFIAPLMAGSILNTTGGVGWAYWLVALAGIPIVLFVFFQSSPRHPQVTEESGGNQPVKGVIAFLSLFIFLHIGAELSIGGWIYTYALRLGLADETGAAFLNSAYWGALTVGRLLSVAVALKMRARSMLIMDLAGCAAGSLLLLLFPGSLTVVWVGTILLGASIASLVPATFNYAGKNMNMSGRTTSWFIIGIAAGGLLFPWLIGQIFESVGPVILPIVVLGTFILAGAVLAVVYRLVKVRSLQGSPSPPENEEV